MASVIRVWTSVFESFRSSFSREQPINPTSRNTNLIFIVSSLLGFLQIKSQVNAKDSPFLTHPITCNVAITTLLLYGLAYDAEQRFSVSHPIVANAACRGMGLFGSLLMASLASILFPRWAQPVLYVVCMILFYAEELIDWLQRRFIGELEQMDIPPA